jgi:hypothetical protein
MHQSGLLAPTQQGHRIVLSHPVEVVKNGPIVIPGECLGDE